METRNTNRGAWHKEWGFIFAALGSAIGLGNFWRFSYMAYENGGGAFLIPYLVALFTVGIPLLLLELSLGHLTKGSPPVAFAGIRKNWEWLGWWAVLVALFGIELYYSVIISWCANYFVFSFNLQWGNDPNGFFFKHFLQISDDPGSVGGIRMPILIGTAVIWILNWGILYRGISRGIELANKIFMPALFVLTAVLVAWSLTLKGAEVGILAYLKPDFSKLAHPKVWIDAYSQIFFTLSVGFGIMIAYASYLPSKANLTRSALITGCLNCGFSLFAGFATFSILGYIAVSQNKAVSDVVSQNIGLAFVTYPKALSLLPGGPAFGAFFFFCLVMAGLSSSVSLVEAMVCSIVDKFGYSRRRVVTLISILGFFGSLIFTCRGGLYWLDIVDHYTTHYGLVVVGATECILAAWLYRVNILRKHINEVSTPHVGAWWDFLIRYFIPAVLLVLIGTAFYNEMSQAYEGYKASYLLLIGLDWLLATLIAAGVLASRPWRFPLVTGQEEGS